MRFLSPLFSKLAWSGKWKNLSGWFTECFGLSMSAGFHVKEREWYWLSCGLRTADGEWEKPVQHGDWRTEGWRSQRGYCFSGQAESVRVSYPQLNLPSDTAVCVSRIHFRCLLNHYEDMYTHTPGVKCITWCLSSPRPLLRMFQVQNKLIISCFSFCRW